MTLKAGFFCAVLAAAGIFATSAGAQENAEVAGLARIIVPSTAGAVDGLSINSDQFIWQKFIAAVTPVAGHNRIEFQTWATDQETYVAPPNVPVWPSPDAPVKFKASTQAAMHHSRNVGVPCAPAENPWVGAFPLDGCIAEEVRRNKPEFDYIKANKLYNKAGIAAFYAKAGAMVNMPKDSVSLKADWVPVTTIMEWVPNLKSKADVRRFYYTTMSDGVEYGLVAMHLISAWNPWWVWGTFEHQFNPGRCDATGCYDSFGARKPVVQPNYQKANTQYGACTKSPKLKRLMSKAGLPGAFDNYCLKSTQVSFIDKASRPTVLTNSVTERIAVNGELIGSCISCHAYASFGAEGAPTTAATTMLEYNPVGTVFPSALEGTKSYDFNWGVLNAQ